MAKPAAGTGLDALNSLYSVLTAASSAVWGMLEGSGTTSADSSGNARTLTLNTSGSGVTWTTIGGDPALAFAGCSTRAATVANPVAMDGTASYSVAWRGKQTTSGFDEVVCGNDNTGGLTNFLGMEGGTPQIRLFSGADNGFTSAGTFLVDHDWLVVFDQPAARLHCYKDGTEVSGSPLTISTAASVYLGFYSVGSGYNVVGTLCLIGTLTYLYLMAGYAASSTDAGNLAANPYSIFQSGTVFDPAAGFSWPDTNNPLPVRRGVVAYQ